MLEMDIESKRKLSPTTIIISFLFSFLLISVGCKWLRQFTQHGYYNDSKNHIIVYGSEGLVTIYAIICGGVCLGLYGIYLLWIYNKKN